MANVNSLMTSSSTAASSLYGNRNVLTGLASGMDTEAMIENSVSGYKTKITQLEQEQTKYQWKQDAYRAITDKMYQLNQKYTSYTSKTNLYSNAFFNTSVSTNVVADGVNAAANVSKVSATGKSSSDIQILAATTAAAARYSVSASALSLQNPGANASSAVKASDAVSVSALKGTMTLTYGSQTIDIAFDEIEDKDIHDATSLKQAIQSKLGKINIATSNGVQSASSVISVSVTQEDDGSIGEIAFAENGNNGGYTPYISAIDSSLRTQMNVSSLTVGAGSGARSGYQITGVKNDSTSPLQKTLSAAEYLNGKEISVTLDGATKSFKLSGLTSTAETQGLDANQQVLNTSTLVKSLQDGIDKAFGENKATVRLDGGKLSFDLANDSSAFAVSAKDSGVGAALGIGKSGLTSYLNTGSSIGTLLNGNFDFASHAIAADSAVRLTEETDKPGFFKGDDGNRYKKIDNDYLRVNDQGELLYELKINNKSIYISEESTMDSVLNSINNSDAGVTASYSKLTGKFVFAAKDTGAASSVTFDNDLAKSLFVGDPRQRALKDVLGLDASAGDFTLNMLGYTVGTFNVNSTLQEVMDVIENKTAGHGIRNTIVYDSDTGTFRTPTANSVPSSWKFTAYDAQGNAISNTLTAGEFFKNFDEVAKDGYVHGADATIVANVNGEPVTLKRASNTIDMDGLSVNLKESFGDVDAPSSADAVSFKTTSDADSIIKTVKEFLDDYNAVLKAAHDAYATQPAEKNSSSHSKYEPLTDDDKATMSETAIKNYEEKAKQGILFGDSDLSALYSRMVNSFSTGANAAALKDIGITVNYSSGLSQINLNESELRAALESNPDKVRETFTRSTENGAAYDGLMTSVKNLMERYASTSIGSPGILVKKAGSTFSSNSLLSNTIQTQIDNVQAKIEKWQTKMSAKIDYYTRQFTALEKLMNTMNSQSSALAGLMGGY